MSHQLVAAASIVRAVGHSGRWTTDRLTVEIRRHVDLEPHDARALDAMMNGRPYVGAFLSPAWLNGSSRVRHQAPTSSSCYYGKESNCVAGSAAGASNADARPRLARRRWMRFRSRRRPRGRGFEALVADTFLGWLAQTFGAKGYLLELRDVPATSSLWGAIHRAGVEGTLRITIQPREIYTLPYLSLDTADPPAALDSPSARALQSLVKHRRWLEHRCRLHIDLVEEQDDALEAFRSSGPIPACPVARRNQLGAR
jgi:hypothetical protein